MLLCCLCGLFLSHGVAVEVGSLALQVPVTGASALDGTALGETAQLATPKALPTLYSDLH